MRPSDVRPAWERRLRAQQVVIVGCLLLTVIAVAIGIGRL